MVADHTPAENESEGNVDPQAELKELDRRSYLKDEDRKRTRKLFYFFLGLAVASPIFVLAHAAADRSQGGLGGIFGFFRGDPDTSAEVSLIFIIYAVLFVITAVMQRARLRDIEVEKRDLDFEIELSRNPISQREIRAERLFKMNQYEVMKYYSLNRNQNRLIVVIGVCCILVGLLVVFLTLYLVMGGWFGRGQDSGAGQAVKEFDVWIKAIVAFVGALGTILVNYVAAIFLKMHSAVAKALGEFHERLVGTNQLFLANVLASRIEDDTKRQETLAELAKAITKK